MQVLEAGDGWGLPATGPPAFPGAGDRTLLCRLWPGGLSASPGRSCPEILGLQAWRELSGLLRSLADVQERTLKFFFLLFSRTE